MIKLAGALVTLISPALPFAIFLSFLSQPPPETSNSVFLPTPSLKSAETLPPLIMTRPVDGLTVSLTQLPDTSNLTPSASLALVILMVPPCAVMLLLISFPLTEFVPLLTLNLAPSTKFSSAFTFTAAEVSSFISSNPLRFSIPASNATVSTRA